MHQLGSIPINTIFCGLLIRRSSVRATHNPPDAEAKGQFSGTGLFLFAASQRGCGLDLAYFPDQSRHQLNRLVRRGWHQLQLSQIDRRDIDRNASSLLHRCRELRPGCAQDDLLSTFVAEADGIYLGQCQIAPLGTTSEAELAEPDWECRYVGHGVSPAGQRFRGLPPAAGARPAQHMLLLATAREVAWSIEALNRASA